jgi:hypothetical protein
MVFPRDSDNATLRNALDGLRQLAREEQTQDNNTFGASRTS